MPGSRILMLNAESDFSRSVGESLERAGHSLCYPGVDDADIAADCPSDAVLFPWRAPRGALQDLDVEQFTHGLDAMLATAARHVRATGLQPDTARLLRLVVVSGWEANGGMDSTCMAAVSGALLGLARSWALEFSPLGITVNAVIPGPDYSGDRYKTLSSNQAGLDDLAYAICFFLDPRAHAISGQVVAVCAGRSPATIPV